MIANVAKESFRYFFRAGTGSASTLEGVLDFDGAAALLGMEAADVQNALQGLYKKYNNVVDGCGHQPAVPLVVSVAEPRSQGRYAFVAGGFGRPHSRETIQAALGVSPSSASSSVVLDAEQVSRGGNTDASTFFISHVST